MGRVIITSIVILWSFWCLLETVRANGDEGRPNLKTLRLVEVILRHGQRNQLGTYPLDPYQNEQRYWPDGFAQLTEAGLREAYEVGRHIRSQYDGFLSETYNQYEVLAFSSHTDRTIRTALAAVRGIFPSHESKNVSENAGWAANQTKCVRPSPQVVPVRSVPRDYDDYIIMERPCPAFRDGFERVMQESERSHSLHSEYPDVIRIVNTNAGINATTLYDRDLLYTLDALNAQRLQSVQLPTWVTPDLVQFIEKYILWYLEAESATPFLKKLRSGIADSILQHMKDKVDKEGNIARKKFVLLSGHDRTIVTFLNIIGDFNKLPVPYASAVFIELHRDLRYIDHHIEIYYRNDSSKAAYRIQPSFCRDPCFLDEFRIFVANLVPVSWTEACQMRNSGPPSNDGPTAHFVLICVFTSLLSLWLLEAASRNA